MEELYPCLARGRSERGLIGGKRQATVNFDHTENVLKEIRRSDIMGG